MEAPPDGPFKFVISGSKVAADDVSTSGGRSSGLGMLLLEVKVKVGQTKDFMSFDAYGKSKVAKVRALCLYAWFLRQSDERYAFLTI